MRTVNDGGNTAGPGLSSIGGTDDPFPEIGLASGVAQPDMDCLPAGQLVRWHGVFVSGHGLESGRKPGLVGEGGEAGDEQGALDTFHHSGVAVVGGRIQQHPRPGPGDAFVGRHHGVDLTERADMGFAPAGPSHPELTIPEPGDGRPPMIVFRLLGNDLRFQYLCGGSGAVRKAGKGEGGGGDKVSAGDHA